MAPRKPTFSQVAENIAQSMAPAPPEDDAGPGMCHAPGCPMFGTMSHQVIGATKRWYCCCHFGAAAKHHDEITTLLRNRIAAVNALNLVRGMRAGYLPLRRARILAALKDAGWDDFADFTSSLTLLQRMQSALLSETADERRRDRGEITDEQRAAALERML